MPLSLCPGTKVYMHPKVVQLSPWMLRVHYYRILWTVKPLHALLAQDPLDIQTLDPTKPLDALLRRILWTFKSLDALLTEDYLDIQTLDALECRSSGQPSPWILHLYYRILRMLTVMGLFDDPVFVACHLDMKMSNHFACLFFLLHNIMLVISGMITHYVCYSRTVLR